MEVLMFDKYGNFVIQDLVGEDESVISFFATWDGENLSLFAVTKTGESEPVEVEEVPIKMRLKIESIWGLKFPRRRDITSGSSEKIDTLDLIINVLREHEKSIDEKLNRIDGLIDDLCDVLEGLKRAAKG